MGIERTNPNNYGLLKQTISGVIAYHLDNKDGSADGKIDKNIWDNFCKTHASDCNYHSLDNNDFVDATDSICRYAERKARMLNDGRTATQIATEWAKDMGINIGEVMKKLKDYQIPGDQYVPGTLHTTTKQTEESGKTNFNTDPTADAEKKKLETFKAHLVKDYGVHRHLPDYLFNPRWNDQSDTELRSMYNDMGGDTSGVDEDTFVKLMRAKGNFEEIDAILKEYKAQQGQSVKNEEGNGATVKTNEQRIKDIATTTGLPEDLIKELAQPEVGKELNVADLAQKCGITEEAATSLIEAAGDLDALERTAQQIKGVQAQQTPVQSENNQKTPIEQTVERIAKDYGMDDDLVEMMLNPVKVKSLNKQPNTVKQNLAKKHGIDIDFLNEMIAAQGNEIKLEEVIKKWNTPKNPTVHEPLPAGKSVVAPELTVEQKPILKPILSGAINVTKEDQDRILAQYLPGFEKLSTREKLNAVQAADRKSQKQCDDDLKKINKTHDDNLNGENGIITLYEKQIKQLEEDAQAAKNDYYNNEIKSQMEDLDKQLKAAETQIKLDDAANSETEAKIVALRKIAQTNPAVAAELAKLQTVPQVHGGQDKKDEILAAKTILEDAVNEYNKRIDEQLAADKDAAFKQKEADVAAENARFNSEKAVREAQRNKEHAVLEHEEIKMEGQKVFDKIDKQYDKKRSKIEKEAGIGSAEPAAATATSATKVKNDAETSNSGKTAEAENTKEERKAERQQRREEEGGFLKRLGSRLFGGGKSKANKDDDNDDE